jgi:hypothetical protein
MRPPLTESDRGPPRGTGKALALFMPPGLFQPPLRAYVLLCVAALGVFLLAQLDQGAGLGSVLVVLVGLLGVLARLHSAPLLFVLVLAVQQILRHVSDSGYRRGLTQFASLEVSDVVMCAAVLAYVVAHYRLQGLLQNVIPLDPRRREGPPRWHFWRFYWLPRLAPERRSPRGISPYEIPLLLLTLPAAALAAQMVWAGLTRGAEPLELPPPLWRILLIAWVLGMGLFLLAAAMQQWKRRRMSPEEAALMLQDILWFETRREQRRINRWLAWAHLRRRQRKELS